MRWEKMLRLPLIFTMMALPGLPAAASASDRISAAVFYDTYEETGNPEMRGALDLALEKVGIRYQDYDYGGSSQAARTEMIAAAAAKGAQVFAVCLAENGSEDFLENILDQADDRLVLLFGCPAEEDVFAGTDTGVFVGADDEMTGRAQGEMIGSYLEENYGTVDRNNDGTISCALYGEQGDNRDARILYVQEAADAILRKAGYPSLSFCDATDGNRIELIVADNDEATLECIAAQSDTGGSAEECGSIPVFGTGVSDTVRDAVSNGIVTGTAGQDAERTGNAIALIAGNFLTGAGLFEDIEEDQVVEEQCVKIPCLRILHDPDSLSVCGRPNTKQ